MSQCPSMQLKKGRARPALAGHPWVFSGALKSGDEATPGQLVALHDDRGTVIGYGHAGGGGPIAIRVLSLGETQPNEEELIQQRIHQALARRTHLQLPTEDTDVYRVVSSEGDRLPGLIAERMGKGLVVQLGSAGMIRLEAPIIETLRTALAPSWIVLQVPTAAARMESLLPRCEVVDGEEEAVNNTTVREWGIRYHIDPLGGQKTGFYADQRENRQRVSQFTPGRRVLDAHCFGGAFGITAKLLGNAKEVVSVDSSPRATRLAARNAELNDVSIEVITADVMAFLRESKEEAWDLVIVDPPKFVKSRAHLVDALKKYRKLNEMALRALSNDGILVSNSCSSMVNELDFLRMLTEAGYAAGKHIHILELRGQAPDHPYLSACPESRYLKCAIATVTSR